MEDVNDQFDDRIPDELAKDLAGLYGRGPRVPGEMDRKILSMGRARMAGQRRMRIWVRWGGAVAAAAMIAIAVRTVLVRQGAVRPEAAVAVRERVITAEEMKQGKVDILDAYLLARRIELGEKLSTQWDMNGDGQVDQGDAKRIAQAAVSLRGGEVQ